MNKITFMTPSKMAKCYGVSLPTFLEWLKPIIGDNPDIEIFFEADWSFFETTHRISSIKFRCKYKTISPDEVKTICFLIGDTDCCMNFEKTTITSLAKEAGISPKTAIRIASRHMNEQSTGLFTLNYTRKTKCLTPKEMKIIRKLFGIE